MHIEIQPGVRLFVDIEGLGHVPEGRVLRHKPTLILIHGGPGFDQLPQTLRDYIDHGDRLFERVQQFDKLERGGIAEIAPPATEGSIGDQLARLKAAFGKLQA